MEQEELTQRKKFTQLLHFLSETKKKMVEGFHETGKVKKKKTSGSLCR